MSGAIRRLMNMAGQTRLAETISRTYFDWLNRPFVKSDYVYVVSTFTEDGTSGGCKGIFRDRRGAIAAVTHPSAHDSIWEYAYGIACIEKMRFNSLGHPGLVARQDREPIAWYCWEPVDSDQDRPVGRYVAMEYPPEWADGVFGWI